MDPLAIGLAFLLGFAARQASLPPLVGFLGAGFVLHAAGIEGGETIGNIADLGVTLLLFTIGLKLKVKGLMRPEIWAGTTIHLVVIVVVLGVAALALSRLGVATFAGLDLGTAFLIGFALSFSSTVFAVKVLEDKGEVGSLHGRTAIGILIMQDVIAVVFLTLSTAKLPSPWAFALLGLPLLRPILGLIMDRCGHGELLPMFGLFAALALGAHAFELVGMKADLGALVLGMLMSHHKRASEVAESLFGLKEVFLVGFFLNIGLAGAPSLEGLLMALALLLVLPLKALLFFAILTRFRLRARSSLLASLILANFSEFGLICGAIGVENAWLDEQWLVIIAIALALSFVLEAPINGMAHDLYARFVTPLRRFESPRMHPEEAPILLDDADIVIFGMGRIGTGAYDHIRETLGARGARRRDRPRACATTPGSRSQRDRGRCHGLGFLGADALRSAAPAPGHAGHARAQRQHVRRAADRGGGVALSDRSGGTASGPGRAAEKPRRARGLQHLRRGGRRVRRPCPHGAARRAAGLRNPTTAIEKRRVT
jgi:glutathione-regulated potassium-efflux system ancillary protein KefC